MTELSKTGNNWSRNYLKRVDKIKKKYAKALKLGFHVV